MASTVSTAAFPAAGTWAAALISSGTVYVIDPEAPVPAWHALPALPAGTPVSVGLANGGASVLVVMSNGAAYKLLNEQSGRPNTNVWIPLPSVPTP
jgi:hypothetical protein